jgi:hypothetical protein
MSSPDVAVTYFTVLHNSHPGKEHAADGELDCGWAYDDQRIVGVYSTQEKAVQAIEDARRLPGFSADPPCFVIDEDTVGDEWSEGFITEFWT